MDPHSFNRIGHRYNEASILAVIFALLLIVSTACSSIKGKHTPIPATTAAPQSLEDLAPSTMLYDPTMANPGSSAKDKESFTDGNEIFVASGGTESVSINLKARDTLRVTYEAIPQVMVASTARAGVILTLTGPGDQQFILADDNVDDRQPIASGTSDTVLDTDGEYQLEFFNPLPIISLVVKFEYVVNP